MGMGPRAHGVALGAHHRLGGALDLPLPTLTFGDGQSAFAPALYWGGGVDGGGPTPLAIDFR